jgi:hypothetical protein
LTQQTQDGHKKLRQADIEITPEMIAAGVNALDESGRLIEGVRSGDSLLVREVFEAMRRASRR